VKDFYSVLSQKNRQTGFSLLEVLVAIVVTSIGLLGLAAMQATGLRNNHSAYHRSQATVLAYDMADRMRSNVGSMASYITPLGAATPVAGCKTTGGCTAAQLAQNDVAEWNASLASALSGGTGSIVLAGDIFTISVNWDDNRDGLVNANDPGLQVSFQP